MSTAPKSTATIYVQQVREPGGWEDNAFTNDRELAVARYKAFAAGNPRDAATLARIGGLGPRRKAKFAGPLLEVVSAAGQRGGWPPRGADPIPMAMP